MPKCSTNTFSNFQQSIRGMKEYSQQDLAERRGGWGECLQRKCAETVEKQSRNRGYRALNVLRSATITTLITAWICLVLWNIWIILPETVGNGLHHPN